MNEGLKLMLQSIGLQTAAAAERAEKSGNPKVADELANAADHIRVAASLCESSQVVQPQTKAAFQPAPITKHLTDDPGDLRLKRGVDKEPTEQADTYLVLSAEDRAKGFVRPVRTAYKHEKCGTTTTMGLAIAETYARCPEFYGATYCVQCRMHLPVGAQGEFVWLDDGTKVGT